MFDEILIFADAGPRIINDATAADFFVAMFNEMTAPCPTWTRRGWPPGGDTCGMTRPPLSRPQPRGEHGADNSSSWLTPYAKVCARLGCPRSKRKRVLRENLDFIDRVERPKRS